VSASVDDHRPAELVAALCAVRTRIADAATAAGRDLWSVTLIAVTKTFPVTDVAILMELGVTNIGESRDQEARVKVSQLAQRTALPHVHFVGRLQTNKCRSVARYADCVHTVDRLAVATALADGVEAAGRPPLPVFVQVSLDNDPERGGVAATGVAALSDHIAGDARLRLMGLMAVAPLGVEPAVAYERVGQLSM
jgi:PLP dependent protein